jgi:hypothetical protein
MSIQNDKCDAKGCYKEFSAHETKHYCRACRCTFHKKCLSVKRVQDPEYKHWTIVTVCPRCESEMDK